METNRADEKTDIRFFDHNIAQFQMQIKKETDAAKRATLEELITRERAKRKAFGQG